MSYRSPNLKFVIFVSISVVISFVVGVDTVELLIFLRHLSS